MSYFSRLFFLSLLIFSVFFPCSASPQSPLFSIGPVFIQGKSFVIKRKEEQNRFLVRGVALSSNNENRDLLSDQYFDYMSQNILPKLKNLNVNLIRVYQVDPNLSHDKIMALLRDNEIYVMIGTVTKEINVNRLKPEYSTKVYDRVVQVVDSFSKYENVFSFSVGNEVVFPGVIYDGVKNIMKICDSEKECIQKTIDLEKKDAAVLKSLVRDIKRYMRSKHMRAIPVGIAMQDGPQKTIKPNSLIGTDIIAQYYACGDQNTRIDTIGINTYRYLSNGSLNSYDDLSKEVKELPIPIFLSESGAIDFLHPVERDWLIVPQNYTSSLLSDQLSGQIAFQFFNKNEKLGFYDETTLSETEFGGAQNLSKQNNFVSGFHVPFPTENPIDIKCPFDEPMLPSPRPIFDIKISFENFSDVSTIGLYQNQKLINQQPIPGNGKIENIASDSELDLYVLDSANHYALVCVVPAGTLKNGDHIKNNIQWGGNCKIN